MDMTFTNYLIQLSFNLLSSSLPMALLVYFSVRFAIRHGIADIAKASKASPLHSVRDRAAGE
jgi:hypothetical protein